MRRYAWLALGLWAGVILSACTSGPSSSDKAKAGNQSQTATLERKIEFLESLMSRRGLAADVLGDVSAALPDRVWLTEVSYDSGKVRINGNARSNGLVADYISRLVGSASLAEVSLLSSVQRGARNAGYQEFSVEAGVKETRGAVAPRPGATSGPDTLTALTTRLAELEKSLPEGKDTAGALRQFQQLANDSGLKIAKFAPGNEIQGEFYREWPISIEAMGSRQSLGRFFSRVAELPEFWLVKKFSLKATSGQEAALPFRAVLTTQTYLSGVKES
jgi:hypothetical protein